jgi:hypothetical protein
MTPARLIEEAAALLVLATGAYWACHFVAWVVS